VESQEEKNYIYAFDHERELATVNLNGTINLANRRDKLLRFSEVTESALATINSSSKKYIFPKKHAIDHAYAKGYLEGCLVATVQVICSLQDAITYDWTLDVLEKEVYKLIVTSKENFFIAQEDYSNKDAIKIEIYQFCLSQTLHLIGAWRSLFPPSEQHPGLPKIAFPKK